VSLSSPSARQSVRSAGSERARCGGAVGALLLIAVAAFSDGASAHALSPGLNDFTAGVLHPLTALEHVLPMIALGVLAGQRGLHRSEPVLIVFPLAFAAGAVAGLLLPGAPAVFAVNVASAVVLGVLIALARRLPMLALCGLCIAFGLSHGYANGGAIEGSIKPLPFVGGLALAAFFTLAAATTASDVMVRQSCAWTQIGVRVMGSWTAAIGVLVLSIGHKLAFGV